MKEKETNSLSEVLGKTHLSDFDKFVRENKDSLDTDGTSFFVYMKKTFAEKKITQQAVFLKADIPERYGYKLLSGEKRTRQRDVILRICYAAGMNLEETQKALRKYEMPELYLKIPRDALLMIIFNERPGSIIEVNEQLKSKGMDPLKTSGVQD